MQRRKVLKLIPAFALTLRGNGANAQLPPQPQIPAPPVWQALGIALWPPKNGRLLLLFDQIILPGEINISLRSTVRFTQTLALFRHPPGNAAAMEQLVLNTIAPRQAALITTRMKFTTTQTLIGLAKTPTGWFRIEGEVKVGRAQ